LLVARGCEEALQGRVGVADRRYPGPDAVGTHHSGNAILTHSAAGLAQHLVHAWTAISAAAVAVHDPDALGKLRVLVLSLATLA